MIAAIDILNHLYCPRYTYFTYVLSVPQFEDKYFLVQKGREVHDMKTVRNKDYLRKKIGALRKEIQPYLANGKLRGIPDEVLWLDDGTMAPLDYKFSKYEEKLYEPVRQQLITYATLIEDVYGAEVNRGFIVYVRSKNYLLQVDISDVDKQMIRKTTEDILNIIENEIYPEATKNKKKCLNCTYKKLCVH